MSVPDVSVVMGVFNDAQTLGRTLTSVLNQAGCVFEFVVVNDGSTDESGRILEQWAADDARLQVIHQENMGLTEALIRGCAKARGCYIARQDGGGDLSLPGRFVRQVEILDSRPDVVLTSCGTRFVGPSGERLFEVQQQGGELQALVDQESDKELSVNNLNNSCLSSIQLAWMLWWKARYTRSMNCSEKYSTSVDVGYGRRSKRVFSVGEAYRPYREQPGSLGPQSTKAWGSCQAGKALRGWNTKGCAPREEVARR